MLTFLFAIPLNVMLYFGMVKGIDNALGVATFIMWSMAIMSTLSIFTSDEELRKNRKRFLFRWSVRLLTFATVFHSIWWGYYWAPSIWFVASIIVVARRYEIDNRKRY